MEGLQIFSSPDRGRHLLTTCAFSSGQVVVQQPPYAAVLHDDQVPLRCDWCYRGGCKQLLRCSRSKWARYCCREHQRAAWRAGYKAECEALVSLAPRVPPPTVRLAARVLWRRQREAAGESGTAAQPGTMYADVAALQHHFEEHDPEHKMLYAQMAVLVRHFMQGACSSSHCDQAPAVASNSAALPEPREVALLLARFSCNNHSICDEELRPVGVGVYPLGSLINHGCDPNCVQTFNGSDIVFRAIRPIQAGEELTISYVELGATRRERRQQLLHQYFFDIDGPQLRQQPREREQQQQQEREHHHNHQQEQQQQQQEEKQEGQEGQQPQKQGKQEEQVLLQQDGSAGIWVCCHTSGSSPPWTQDKRDTQLTAVVQVAPSGRRTQHEVMAGGLEVCLLPPQAPVQDAEASFGLDAAAAADDNAALQQQDMGPAAAAAAGTVVSTSTDEPAANASVLQQHQQQKPSQQQQQDTVKVHCWGLWALCEAEPSTAAQASPSGSSALSQPALELCQRVAHAVRLQQQGQVQEQEAAHGTAAGTFRCALQLLELQDASGSRSRRAGAISDGNEAGSISKDARLALGPLHVLRMRLNAALLKAAIDAGDCWDVALDAARALVPAYELVYPCAWPSLGLHYAALAKLEVLLERPHEALQAAERAAGILRVTHGGGAQVLRDVLRVRHEAQQEAESQVDD